MLQKQESEAWATERAMQVNQYLWQSHTTSAGSEMRCEMHTSGQQLYHRPRAAWMEKQGGLSKLNAAYGTKVLRYAVAAAAVSRYPPV